MSVSEEAGGSLALQTESSKTWIMRIVDGDILWQPEYLTLCQV